MLKKLLAATAATMIGVALSFTAFAYHGLAAEKPAATTTKFDTASNQVQIKRDHLMTALPNHPHQGKTLFAQNGHWTKVNKVHVVYFDAARKHPKELIIHTQDGLRVAHISKSKLRRFLKDNPQLMTNNNAIYWNEADNLYYQTVSTDKVWLGEKDGKYKTTALLTKAPELQK